MIDLTSLPKETQDRIELKIQSEISYENAVNEDYTDILFKTLKERSNPMVQHSYIATVYGGQGCLLPSSKIITAIGWKSVENIKVGDKVLSVDINSKYKKEWKCVSKTYVYDNYCRLFKITLKNGIVLQTTPNHRLFVDDRYKLVSNLEVGDKLMLVYGNNKNDGIVVDVSEGEKPKKVYDITVDDNSNYIVNGVLSKNSGKSYSTISMCGVLDKKFNIDGIYFDVELLVNDRKKLKPNTAVMVDEMTRLYGMDSVRISIMVNAIKEQLRKKSIHMFYLSPTLKDEYHTSLYVMETMFINNEEKLNYLAYKTNELQTLGYVMIPHPVNFVSRNLLLAYEEKKDMHLSNLLEGGLDAVQDRAEMVMKDAYFLKAEKMYIEARGYIPYKILVQIVEKLFPEFKGSVIVYELADRIKSEREISGLWAILGNKNKKDE